MLAEVCAKKQNEGASLAQKLLNLALCDSLASNNALFLVFNAIRMFP